MEAEVEENLENVAPSTDQSLLKRAEEIKNEKPGENEAVTENQQQQKTKKDEQTSAGGDGGGEKRQVRIRKQVQRFSETMSKRYEDEQASKRAHDPVASQFGRGSGTPLGEIPLIEASLRGCKPVDLKILHYACFGRIGSVADVRSNLRKFSGFSFGRESEEYGKRAQALNRKSVKEVQNALRQLRLEVSGTRVQLVARLLDFLLKPKADAVKYKGKLPLAKRKSGFGRRSLSKKEESDKKGTSKKPKKGVMEGKTEGEELGGLPDDEERGEEEEAEPVAEPVAEEEDDYEEEEEEESGKSDVDYAPGKEVSRKRKSAAVARSNKSPRKTKRRRKQVIESEDDGAEEEEGDDRSLTKEEEEVVDVEAKSASDEMKEPKQEKGAGNAGEVAAGHEGNASPPKIASHPPVFPTDMELKSKVLEILKTANLNEVSMKVVRNSVSDHYKDVDLSSKKQFINSVIEEYLSSSSQNRSRLILIVWRGDVRLATFYGSRPIQAGDFEKLSDRFDVDLGMLERMPVVLRRLQFPATSEAVDTEVCQRQRAEDLREGSPQPRCVPHLSIWRWMPTSGAGTGDSIDVGLLRSTSAFTRCASPRLLQLIQLRYRERSTNPTLPPQSRWLRFDELTLLFNIVINPHAVIASTFPASEGWPFPVQLGACGRMTLEKGTTKSLSQFIFAPVKQRLQILRGLLQLPASLTSNYSLGDVKSADFALYLGDYRWDVFGVDVFTYQVSVIQSRHLIAVDLREIAKSPSPFIIESNASYILQDGCHDCSFASSTPCLSEGHVNQLCASNPSSDHNYWAVLTSSSVLSSASMTPKTELGSPMWKLLWRSLTSN
ncbi:Divergent protein kinase domain 2A [Taenia crassiceps]|uniref:Divergent protein kinase domain 2A n=1 Tax=Taenia crassiceps TaxID=6207 RepID=A0ABR4Q0Q8_9CEST